MIMNIDINVIQKKYNPPHQFPEYFVYRISGAKVYLYKHQYDCTPSYIFFTDIGGNISKTIQETSKLYAQTVFGKYKSAMVEVIDGVAMTLELPDINNILIYNTWYNFNDRKDTTDIKRAIYVSNVSSPSKVDIDSILPRLIDGDTIIVELFANSEPNYDGVALVNTTSLNNTKISTNPAVVNSNFLYSFYDKDVLKKAYVSGNVVSKVFALHSYKDIIGDKTFIYPAFIGDGTILKLDGLSSNYSIGQYRTSESTHGNEWAYYVADNGNIYCSISVSNVGSKITKELHVRKGYKYTFNVFTASETGYDGIVITNTPNFLNDNDGYSVGNVHEYIGKCSGVRQTNTSTYTPKQDGSIYISFLSDSEGIGWIDESGEEDDYGVKYTEYGEVEVIIEKPDTYDVKFYANGHRCIIDNVETSESDYVIGEYISPDKPKIVKSNDIGHAFLGWGNDPQKPTKIYGVDEVINPLDISLLYAIWEDRFGYYKVIVKDIDGDKCLQGADVLFYNDKVISSEVVGTAQTNANGEAIFALNLNDAPDKLYISVILNGYTYNSVRKDITRSDTKDMTSDVEVVYLVVSDDGENAELKSLLMTNFSKLSSNNIKKCINDNDKSILEYDDTDYKIRVVEPDSVNTLDIFNAVPVMNNDNKNVIGSVDVSLKPDTNELNLKTINRYSGYYNPIFKDILFYNDFNADCPYSNTEFDDTYEDNYGKFGIIKNMWFHKVNDEKSTEIVTSLTPYYPLTGQYALDYKDYNIFSSSWDMNYYTKQLDIVHSQDCKHIASMKNGLCMFGSKYLNTPNVIEIECLSGHQEWNDDWITDPNGCDGEMMYKEVNRNSVNFYFFLKKRILRYFYEKLNKEFSMYINPKYSYGNEGLEDDINDYVNKNILKLYKLEKIRVFVKQDKSGVHDNRINNDYISYIDKSIDDLKNNGFNEVNTISMSKISLDEFDRQITYNLKNGYKEDFGFSFIIKKI